MLGNGWDYDCMNSPVYMICEFVVELQGNVCIVHIEEAFSGLSLSENER